MKISDEARMDIAGRLRNAVESSGELPGVPDSEIFCILGIGTGFADGFADKEDVEVVADLIDRGTCRNVYNEDDPQACANGFECDVCGNRVEDCEHYTITGKFEYCSGCGRVVVE